MPRALLLLLCAFAVFRAMSAEEILPGMFDHLFDGKPDRKNCNVDALADIVKEKYKTDNGEALLARYHNFRTESLNMRTQIVNAQDDGYFTFNDEGPRFNDFHKCQEDPNDGYPKLQDWYRALDYGRVANSLQFDRLALLQCGPPDRNSEPYIPIRIGEAEANYDDWKNQPVWMFFEVDGVLLYRVCSLNEDAFNYIFMWGTREREINCPAKEYPAMFTEASNFGQVTTTELRKAFKIPGDYNGELETNNPYLATIAGAIAVAEVARDYKVSQLNALLLDLADADKITPEQIIGGLCPSSACNCRNPDRAGDGWHLLAFGVASKSYYNAGTFANGMEIDNPSKPPESPAKKYDLWFAANRKQLAAQYSYGYIVQAHETRFDVVHDCSSDHCPIM